MTAKPPTDWEAIEREYRAGQLSVTQVGRAYGVSHTAINKRAKKESWARDLTAKVREAASARLVSDGVVSASVSAPNARETIDVAAARVVDVVRSHRRDISVGRAMVATLMAELQGGTADREAIEEAIEVETADDTNGQRRTAMLRAVALPSRAGVVKALSEAMKHLVALERQAFSIDATPDAPPAPDGAPTVGALLKLSPQDRADLRAILGRAASRPEGDGAGA